MRFKITDTTTNEKFMMVPLKKHDSNKPSFRRHIARTKILSDAESEVKESSEALSEDQIKVLKDFINVIPDLMELLKNKNESNKSDDILMESNEELEKESDEEDETEEVSEPEEDEDESEEDEEDILEDDCDDMKIHDSIVALDSVTNKVNIEDNELEINQYFENYYKSQLKK